MITTRDNEVITVLEDVASRSTGQPSAVQLIWSTPRGTIALSLDLNSARELASKIESIVAKYPSEAVRLPYHEDPDGGGQ